MAEGFNSPARPVEIAGATVNLRTLLPDDAPAMYEAVTESAAELSTTMAWYHEGFSLEEARDWATLCQSLWDQGQHYELCILDKDSRVYLGSCAVGPVNRQALTTNLSYWVRTLHTNRGIASQAARLAAQWACQALALQRIEILVVTSNVPSWHVALKAGATQEGVLRNRLRWDGLQYDAASFSFIPADFADGVSPR